jgi:hypothetical protein
MFGTYFYHQRVRKAVAVFGSLFNNIYVLRKNSSGEVISQAKVPLSYAPKRNFIERIEQMNKGEDAERQIAIKLPRMSFEIVSMEYDLSRQLPKINSRPKQLTNGSSSVSDRTRLYTSVPYNINFQLNAYAKSQDDALQIVEQIIPFFNPQYTVSVKPLEDLTDIKDDVPIVLQGLNFQDDYEGPLEARRTIIYTMDFSMKISFYGPLSTGPIIRQVDAPIYQQGTGLTGDSDTLLETLRTTPNPLNVSPDSDFGFSYQYFDALDSV